MNSEPLSYYDISTITKTQAWCRGFHQGATGQGPFGIYRACEENPTPENVELVSLWLKGWSKGRRFYETKQN